MDHENCHRRDLAGFFVWRNGRAKSPQFSVVNDSRRKLYVSVAPVPELENHGDDVGARLILVHRGHRSKCSKVIGFTSEKNEKLEYFFAGDVNRGKILLVPVEGHLRLAKSRVPQAFEDYATMLEEVDGCLRFTRRAEEALDYLFLMLDADCSGFISRSEMEVFKTFVGFGDRITEEEWTDALFGWREGDLDQSLTDMSDAFFKRFILRFCQGHFTFRRGSPREGGVSKVLHESGCLGGRRMRRRKCLQSIFERFGFDADLLPSHVSRYTISLYSERGSISRFSVTGREKVTVERALRSINGILGRKRKNDRLKIVFYTLQCRDWFSVSVSNYSNLPREIMVDCCGSVGALPAMPGLDGFVWKSIVPAQCETVSEAFINSPCPTR